MPLTTEDRLELHDLLGRYCHLIDSGDPAWADLYTEDGVFARMPTPVIGRTALAKVPPEILSRSGGHYRHIIGSIFIEDLGDDSVTIHAYNLLTDWRDGGKLLRCANARMDAIRTPEGWRLTRVGSV
jgi:hypothetical protein